MRAPDARRASSRAPILVTGLHRGGTTWVGRMVGAHRDPVIDSNGPVRNLPQASIDRIRDLTADYWPAFYQPGAWMTGEPGTVS